MLKACWFCLHFSLEPWVRVSVYTWTLEIMSYFPLSGFQFTALHCYAPDFYKAKQSTRPCCSTKDRFFHIQFLSLTIITNDTSSYDVEMIKFVKRLLFLPWFNGKTAPYRAKATHNFHHMFLSCKIVWFRIEISPKCWQMSSHIVAVSSSKSEKFCQNTFCHKIFLFRK